MLRSRCAAHRRYTRGCPDCQANAARYRRVRRAGLADGTWESRSAEGPELEQVRQHLRALLATPGVSGRRVARVSGVNVHTVSWLNGDEAAAVSRPVADAILGVTVAACVALIGSGDVRVDATGSTRRLQALAVDGWSPEALYGLTGIHGPTIRRHRSGVQPHVLQRVHVIYRDVYDKIQSLADPSGTSDVTRQFAVKEGFLGPERWADEDLDNPLAEPLPVPPEDSDDWVAVSIMVDGALRDPRPGKASDYPRPVQREIARQAIKRLGWSYERVAQLLGRSTNTVDYMLHGRADRPGTRRARNV